VSAFVDVGGLVDSMLVAILSSVAGAAASYSTTQSRIKRLEEVTAELKADKASKESLDAVKGAVDRLREDLDRRFDRLEDAIRTMGKPHA
jgi:hypothetical protein